MNTSGIFATYLAIAGGAAVIWMLFISIFASDVVTFISGVFVFAVSMFTLSLCRASGDE